MLLAVDVGNTNMTLGLFPVAARGIAPGASASEGTPGRAAEPRRELRPAARRAAATPRGTVDELEVLVEGLLSLDGRSLSDVDDLACASVVPAVTASIEAIALRRGIRCLVATAATIPIGVLVDRPSEVGADRLVNALAAGRLHGTPAVVVDLGTATTFDAVGADGAFLGGAIAAGAELGLDALASRTARLPRIELRAPERAIGRDTARAMEAGAVFGYEALVAGLLERIRRELADSCGVGIGEVITIATGGLSAAPWTRDIAGLDVFDPDLTLSGLALLHAEVAVGGRLAVEAT